jgi:hypothetical protein
MPGALVGPFGRYELGAQPVTIGRSSSNTLVINDSQVSGRHLQVLPQGAGYLLVDVGSSNGTVYNGVRLMPQVPQALRHGDVIVIGATQLTVELAPGAFAPGPQPAFPGQATNVMPSEQMGFAPAPMDNMAPPVFPAPVPPPAQPFAPYPGTPQGQPPGYYPGPPAPGWPPGAYQGAPGVGVGAPPARKRSRIPLLIGGVLALLIILGGTGLALFLLSHRAPPGPTIPNATAQVVTPFYDSLKKQNYTTATNFFTTDYLQLLGGQQQAATVLQQFDTLRGAVTNYHVVSVKPVNGSATNEVATVNVTRDPSKGAFKPDTLQLVYQKGKWQISQWTPGAAAGS